MPKSAPPPFPDKQAILEFLQNAGAPVGLKDLARHFAVKGADRRLLRKLVSELEEEGQIDKPERRKLAPKGALPAVTVLEISGLDEDGELLAKPARRREDEPPPPPIYMVPEKRSRAALAVGERVLAKLERQEDGSYAARVIRRLGRALEREVLGIYEIGPKGGRLKPTDRKAKYDYRVSQADSKGAEAGELVLAETKPHHRRAGEREAVVIERLGGVDNHRALSLIAVHEHGIPTRFPERAIAEAEAAGPVPEAKRADLRDLPLVTIDGADARDFDDAVFAEADDDPGNPGGWRIVVAIADVAHYVRPDSALDQTARERGNSVYFPDRVVPMLPEALSNGWCSLRPNEERGCLAAHLWINAEGQLKRQKFTRAIMRSAARLTYEQVQLAHDGHPDDTTGPLREPVIAPLYGAFHALCKAREKRGTLDLDVPERRPVLDEAGQVVAIEPRRRLDSHRLIEEFMITANVAAAQELEKRRQPCMYRVHDQPDKARVDALREVLDGLGLRLAKGQVPQPKTFTRILEQVKGTEAATMVSELILRAQAQAVYSPENIGHFGLALAKYAHFTSPIRRYADLLVHRGLISGLKLGDDGLPPQAASAFPALGEAISMTERRAAAAERDAIDRMTAAFLQNRIGEVFAGRIGGVTRFGLFVTLEQSGADGLVPISSLPDDYYVHDETQHSLVGRRWGRVYHLGQSVTAALVEAEPLTGGLILSLVESEEEETPSSLPTKRRRKGAGGPRRKNRR
ncbi:ribonuclease R [Aquibaculum arenosum]|uniref:Ribonuclease R n=1 Tax=Aquibaculum arenosum TaxID=3032591 RepID=A0ABT5YLH9_9PROT|nr:ribonuclease R [Fodinicurvata sp. CAU 1616]MDF2095752.1 ribonuclease R [Fodinicurvata sp. CAU 1616]